MSLVYLLDLQGGLTGGNVGYSRWVPATIGNSQATRAKVAELRSHLNHTTGPWEGTTESHPGLPEVNIRWNGVGSDAGLAETTAGADAGTLLVIARGEDPQSAAAFENLLASRHVPGAEHAAALIAERHDRPLFVRGNWIRGSAAESSIELVQLWLAMAFFEEHGVLGRQH